MNLTQLKDKTRAPWGLLRLNQIEQTIVQREEKKVLKIFSTFPLKKPQAF
ncbi:hypothetical protein [Aggregatibacter actinomycetemcomitans]|nr:hypothetical protein [Aggregatibacter actinomycetemcomitans]